MGATLHTLVVNELRSSASVVQVERHQRQRADYLPELLGLCDAITGIARAKNEQPLLTMLSEIKTRLSHDRVEFVPADIVSVVTNR